jgi:hypothetical protein
MGSLSMEKKIKDLAGVQKGFIIYGKEDKRIRITQLGLQVLDIYPNR